MSFLFLLSLSLSRARSFSISTSRRTVSQVTKHVIEVQKRMEDLIQSADTVGAKLSALDRSGASQTIPSFSQFMAAHRAAGEGQIASPRISQRD